MIRKIFIVVGLILYLTQISGQSKDSYDFAFNEINKMLKGESQLDFKKAVFLTENGFYSNKLDYNEFCQKIDNIEVQIYKFITDRQISNNKLAKQFAIFSYMMEPSVYNNNKKCIYDFEDLTGQKDWTKMFVSKLLNTSTGNCHSLPYLFKILAEETKVDAYLALGPNHLYIKHKDDKGQWVNVELTNGTFPRDGWLISSLSISTEAIKQGTYMEPLSLKESIALCLYDLALGYQFQFGYDDFGIKCCDTLLSYFPKCIYAYMVKAEIYTQQRKTLLSASNNQKNSKILELESILIKLYDQIDMMGYQEMPKEQYEQWVKDAESEKLKHQQK